MQESRLSMAGLLRSTLRRYGWRCVAFVVVLEVMHYLRLGSLDLSDVRDGLIALCVAAVIALMIEANRKMHEVQAAQDAHNAPEA